MMCLAPRESPRTSCAALLMGLGTHVVQWGSPPDPDVYARGAAAQSCGGMTMVSCRPACTPMLCRAVLCCVVLAEEWGRLPHSLLRHALQQGRRRSATVACCSACTVPSRNPVPKSEQTRLLMMLVAVLCLPEIVCSLSSEPPVCVCWSGLLACGHAAAD